MSRTCLASVTWLVLVVANTPAQEKSSKEEPPGIFKVMNLTRETIELKGAGTSNYACLINDLEIQDVAGKKLTADDLRNRVKAGSMVIVAADEDPIDPAYLKIVKDDTVVLRGVTVLLARADNPGRGWTTDRTKMKPNDDPVAGRILGADFKPDKIQLLNTGLSLQGGKDMMHIFLNLKPGQGIEGKTFEFGADEQQTPGRPAVHVHVHSTKPIGVEAYTTGYTMRLEFGKEKDGNIPAKIYLCLPDNRKSWLAGTFTLSTK